MIPYYQIYIEIVSLEKQVLIRGRHFYALRGIRQRRFCCRQQSRYDNSGRI